MQMTCLAFLAHQEKQQILEHRFAVIFLVAEPVRVNPARSQKPCLKMCPLNYSHKQLCLFISAGFSIGGLRGGGIERTHIWCTMFIQRISYLCSTRGNVYADDWWLYLTAFSATPTWEHWVQGQQRPTAAEPRHRQKCNKSTQPCYKYTTVSLTRWPFTTYINYGKYMFGHLQQLGFTTADLCFHTNTTWMESSRIHSIPPDRNYYHRKPV